MRNAVTLVLTLILSTVAFGQTVGKDDDKGFEVPSKHISVLLITDEMCPIQLSGPSKVIGWSNGAVSLGFNLQNVSKENIESFEIQETNWFGSTGYTIPATMNENFFFVPLATMSADDWLGDRNDSLLAFDEKKVGKTVLHPANKIWIAMIVKAKLSDGTVYDASKKYDELTAFLNKQFDEYDSGQITMDEREQKLRDFINKLMKAKN